MPSHLARLRPLPVVAALALLVTLVVAAPGQAARPAVDYTLTLLHNNDGESNILPDDTAAGTAEDPSGGIAPFATLVDRLRHEALTGRPTLSGHRGAAVVSSGDNFLAGPEWNASLEKGVPFYDSIALDHIGYDAMTIGNHEFDFGPSVLADFIAGFSPDVPFISANLDVSAVPELAALADAGRLTASTVIRERGERIGIIGATTPQLASISSPGAVVVEAVLSAVQAEVDRLTAMGVEIIVLSSHLQDLNEELVLVPQLRDVDIVIAGGGDENLGEAYPLVETDAEGEDVYVVTTPGSYKWVGRLVVGFDRAGEPVTAADTSALVPVTADIPPDPFVQSEVVDPVAAFVAELDATVVATSEVALNGLRGSMDNGGTPGDPTDDTIDVPGVRTTETNLGDLMADALRGAAEREAGSFGLPAPDIALQNGGGIRNDSILPPGDLTLLDTFAIAPFSNFVSVVEGVTRQRLHDLLEHSVADVGGGQFGQWSGLRFTYDPTAPPGDRVTDAWLTSGAADVQVVSAGAVVDGPAVTLATIDFLAAGGDAYPLADLGFTRVGVTYQQALATHLEDTLGGTVTAAEYPEGGAGRITRLGP